MEPVRFTLSEQDMVAAQRDCWRGSMTVGQISKIIFWLWLLDAGLMLGIELLSGDFYPITIILGIIGMTLIGAIIITLLLVLLGYALTPYHARKAYRQHEAIRAPASVPWDDEKIVISNDYGNSNLPWRSYIGWLDGRDNVLLYQSDRLFNILPKDSFDEALRAQAMAHLRAAGVPEKSWFRLG